MRQECNILYISFQANIEFSCKKVLSSLLLKLSLPVFLKFFTNFALFESRVSYILVFIIKKASVDRSSAG